MKIALVHDYIKEYGGAEGVLFELHKMFPDAPIYTSVYLPDYLGPNKGKFANAHIKTSFLQFLPLKQKMIGLVVMFSPFIFKSFDFSDYDIVITSATGAYFPNFLDKGKAKLVCYCHTPPRWLYGYKTARNWDRGLLKIASLPLKVVGRWLDKKASTNVDQYIANSEEVSKRIKDFYDRDSVVTYPPVQMCPEDIVKQKSKGKYFITGGRLARNKRFDVVIKAFTQLKIPLKVYGKSFAGYENELKKHAGENIEFMGEITDDSKWKLMANAKAYINCSDSEDFGMTTVEVESAGTPVIAFKSGGVKESLIDRKTGIFFNDLTTDSLKKAIEIFNKLKLSEEDCVLQAKRFSAEKFRDRLNGLIKD